MPLLARRPSTLALPAGFFLALALAWFGSAVILTAAEPARAAAVNVPKGARVYSIGHSFHVFMPPILTQIARLAGIADHHQAGISSIGGSYVIQHWDAPGGKSKAKAAIESGKLDVLTIAPLYLPDEGIENFVRLVSEKSPRTRVLIQEFWLPYDAYVNFRKDRPQPPNREVFDLKKLEADHDRYFREIDDLVRGLNQKYQGKPAIFVVPVGQAVLTLRKAIADGTAPGLSKQTDLFRDPTGHPRSPLEVLVAYCYFAEIYGRSPVAPLVPPALNGVGDEATTAKLNRLLEEIAWRTVTAHPLSGVKAK
jgi:hypothetical protein